MKEHEWYRTLTSVEDGMSDCELHVCKNCGLNRTSVTKVLPCPPWHSAELPKVKSELDVLKRATTKVQAALVLANDNEDETQGNLLQDAYQELDRLVSIREREDRQ